MHIDQLTLAKFSIKRKTHFICLRTCYTVDFGQVWPENDTHDWPLDKVVTQRTMAKYGNNNDAPHQRTLSHCGLWPNVARIVPLIGGLYHTADFDQMWPKLCPLLEDFVTQQTLTKCGPNCAPHWRICHAVDFNQMWPKLCPTLEDFVTQQTLTKCGPNSAPCRRTLSRSGLWPKVVKNVPLVGGLCFTVDFNQMWSKHMPLVRGLCHTADFDQMWSKHVPFTEWLRFATEFDHIWINNILVIKKGRYQTNGF